MGNMNSPTRYTAKYNPVVVHARSRILGLGAVTGGITGNFLQLLASSGILSSGLRMLP